MTPLWQSYIISTSCRSYDSPFKHQLCRRLLATWWIRPFYPSVKSTLLSWGWWTQFMSTGLGILTKRGEGECAARQPSVRHWLRCLSVSGPTTIRKQRAFQAQRTIAWADAREAGENLLFFFFFFLYQISLSIMNSGIFLFLFFYHFVGHSVLFSSHINRSRKTEKNISVRINGK